jgi:hypothetical protein
MSHVLIILTTFLHVLYSTTFTAKITKRRWWWMREHAALVEGWERKTEHCEKTMSKCRFVHHKFRMGWPVCESRPQRKGRWMTHDKMFKPWCVWCRNRLHNLSDQQRNFDSLSGKATSQNTSFHMWVQNFHYIAHWLQQWHNLKIAHLELILRLTICRLTATLVVVPHH